VDDLHVNSQLAAIVIDDQDTNGTATISEGIREAGPEVGLINDGNVLLDITSLGHGNNRASLEIKNSVLSEDWAEHSLQNNAWGWVGDDGRLLSQLLGEKINTQVAVLTGSRGGGDLDQLTRTTLKDEDVTEADEMGGDGDVVGRSFRRHLGWFRCSVGLC